MAKVKEQPKLYVVRKYVMARSVIEAARKEKDTPAHEVFIDEKFTERNLIEAMGLTIQKQEV